MLLLLLLLLIARLVCLLLTPAACAWCAVPIVEYYGVQRQWHHCDDGQELRCDRERHALWRAAADARRQLSQGRLNQRLLAVRFTLRAVILHSHLSPLSCVSVQVFRIHDKLFIGLTGLITDVQTVSVDRRPTAAEAACMVCCESSIDRRRLPSSAVFLCLQFAEA